MISRRVLLSVAVASGIGSATNVRAQSYPDKPIKLVVPFPPGGPIDTMARLVAQGMSSNLGQQVVDNLNASMHVRALLTDLFLIDEILKQSQAAGTRHASHG